MYNCGVVTVSASQARQQFADTLRRVRGGPVVIERRGVREAVLLDPAEYDRLIELADDAADVAAFDASMADEGSNVSWEQAKADLGWT